jgi:hypothetical protein
MDQTEYITDFFLIQVSDWRPCKYLYSLLAPKTPKIHYFPLIPASKRAKYSYEEDGVLGTFSAAFLCNQPFVRLLL